MLIAEERPLPERDGQCLTHHHVCKAAQQLRRIFAKDDAIHRPPNDHDVGAAQELVRATPTRHRGEVVRPKDQGEADTLLQLCALVADMVRSKMVDERRRRDGLQVAVRKLWRPIARRILKEGRSIAHLVVQHLADRCDL
eukprot:6208853-Pleurochrysis_carterae.AAC.1